MFLVNPNGSLPSGIVNQVVQSIPQCVVNIVSWRGKDGLIPYVRQESPKSSFRIEWYTDEASKEYKLGLILHADDEELDVAIDDQIKYRNGYKVKVENDAKEFVKLEREPSNIKIKFGKEADGKKLDMIVTSK
jgi:hypothetical protein